MSIDIERQNTSRGRTVLVLGLARRAMHRNALAGGIPVSGKLSVEKSSGVWGDVVSYAHRERAERNRAVTSLWMPSTSRARLYS